MPDSKITALASTGTGTDPANDPLVIVDVSDTSMAATGTTKKVTLNNLLACSPTATLASATITGDLTVDTSTLKVDSANNRVGIVNASPAYPLDVVGNINTNSEVYAQGGRLALYRSAGASYVDWSSGQDLIYRTVTSVGGSSPSELMRLNSTGLGVGRSPSYKLDIAGVGNFDQLRVSATAATQIGLVNATNGLTYSLYNANTASNGFNGFGIFDGSSYVMRIDSSGNVGVGVTPSAWNVNYNVIQFGLGSSLATYKTGGTYDQSFVSSNVFENTSGNWRFINNGYGAQYLQYAGAHWFRTSTTQNAGGANQALTWNTGMKLDENGRLILLALTTTPATLATNGELTMTATSNTNLRFSYRGSDGTTRVANLTLA